MSVVLVFRIPAPFQALGRGHVLDLLPRCIEVLDLPSIDSANHQGPVEMLLSSIGGEGGPPVARALGAVSRTPPVQQLYQMQQRRKGIFHHIGQMYMR